MYQGFSHFLGFLHHFVLAKLATSNTRDRGCLWDMETVPEVEVHDYDITDAAAASKGHSYHKPYWQ